MSKSARYKLSFKVIGSPDESKIYRETKQIVVDVDFDKLKSFGVTYLINVANDICLPLHGYILENLKLDFNVGNNAEIESGDFDELFAGPDQ